MPSLQNPWRQSRHSETHLPLLVMEPAWPTSDFFLGAWTDDDESKIKVVEEEGSACAYIQRDVPEGAGRWKCGWGVLQSYACTHEAILWWSETHDRKHSHPLDGPKDVPDDQA